MTILGILEDIVGMPGGSAPESKKSMRTDCGSIDMFAIVIVLVQPPPAATCGRKNVPSAALLTLDCVAGRDVKDGPLNARARTAIGTFELICSCPVKDPVNSGTPANSSVRNRERC